MPTAATLTISGIDSIPMVLPPDVAVPKTEIFDVDVARMLLNAPDGISLDDKKQLKRYLKKAVKGRHVDVVYEVSNKGEEMIGRLYPKGGVGLQMFRREVRNALGNKYYWDVDMVNAQPTLLLQVAQKHGWACLYLERYCNQRDATLKELMDALNIDRDDAKKRLIQLFYGSQYVNGLPEWIGKGLVDELKRIKTNICNTFQALYGKMKKRAKPEESTIAMFLHTHERSCLVALMSALEENGRQMDVLIHDGGLVRKLDDEQEFPESLLRKCEEKIKESTGFEVKLAVKAMESSLLDMEPEDVLDSDVRVDDVYAARAFVDFMKGNLVLDTGVIYVFDESTGMWSCEPAVLERKITEAGTALVFRQIKADGSIAEYNYVGKVKNREALKTILPSVMESQDGYMEAGRERAIGKLLFRDGIYEFARNTFVKGFYRDFVFDGRIARDFPHDIVREDYDYVYDVLFVQPFNNTETPALLLHYLMRATLGDYRCKKFLVGLGFASSGKSLIIEFLKNCLGSYVSIFSGDNLLYRKNTESARELSWAGEMLRSRLAFSSEMKQVSANDKINSNMLKTLTSGGDKVKYRMLYKEIQEGVCRAIPCVMANDLPQFAPADDAVRSRLVAVRYDYSFVEHPDPSRPWEKKADPDLKTKICQEKYYDAFIHLIIRCYTTWIEQGKPEPALPESAIEMKDSIAPMDDLRKVIDELGDYEFTGDDEDFVVYSEFKAYLALHKYEYTDTKLGQFLNALGSVSKVKKIGRQSLRVRTGIKKIEGQ